jgi:hypothetical protein
MQDIEPFYNWRHLYTAEEDPESPFYGREYSEFEYSNTVYNYYIHPQWDDFGSETLYLKILYVDYQVSFAIIEFIGEWNDAIGNDIMFLKRDLIDELIRKGIKYFILIGENILNFHASGNEYYEEWFDDIENGWIVGLNFRDHVIAEFKAFEIDWFILLFSEESNTVNWRKYQPRNLFDRLNNAMQRTLNA